MFGMDLKSLIVGILIGWFGIPYLMGMFARFTAPKAAATA